MSSKGAATELDGFRDLQQLAYAGAEAVAATLEPGVTEREAARRLKKWLTVRGVEDWFHTPFAWFGDRTAFRGFRIPTQFFPTSRRLRDGDPYILDCAPVRKGFVADIGYAGWLGDSAANPAQQQLIADLQPHRRLIVDSVKKGKTLKQIYEDVDALIAAQGHQNRHRVYPGRVIAHQVRKVHSRLPRFIVAGFGIRALRTLAKDLIVERMHHRSPLWANGKISNHPATPGLWAVEPHLGNGPNGAKFEEILVVTEDDAFWLDDDLPHVRRWAAAGSGAM